MWFVVSLLLLVTFGPSLYLGWLFIKFMFRTTPNKWYSFFDLKSLGFSETSLNLLLLILVRREVVEVREWLPDIMTYRRVDAKQYHDQMWWSKCAVAAHYEYRHINRGNNRKRKFELELPWKPAVRY